jgi:SAM domain (Sterile alpha motif)
VRRSDLIGSGGEADIAHTRELASQLLPKRYILVPIGAPSGSRVFDIMSDLRDWLRGNKLEQYAEGFAANDIDTDSLQELTEDDLAGLGISLGSNRGARDRCRPALYSIMSELIFKMTTIAPRKQIKASGHVRSHRKAGHMTASDQCSSRKKLLQVGGHPHMRRPKKEPQQGDSRG